MHFLVWINDANNLVANNTIPKAKDNLASLSGGKGTVSNFESLEVNEDAYSTVERSKYS